MTKDLQEIIFFHGSLTELNGFNPDDQYHQILRICTTP